MNHEKKRTVTLEDLLHLKRAERPPAEFWTTFERDLRAKQLAALVEKRPWWRSLPQAFTGLAPRYHLLLGATAVLAIAFVSMRGLRAPRATAPEGPINMARPAVAVAPAHGAKPGTIAVAPATEVARETKPAMIAAVVSPRPSAATDGASDANVPRVVPVVAMLDETSSHADSPSARSIAANLATVQATDPAFANFLGATRGFEARGLPARAPAVEPLAQVSTSEARRSRLLAAAMPVAFNNYSANSEKVARRISDERLYDTVSRFGARGDRVSVKF